MSLKKAACALLSLSVVLGGGFVCKNSAHAAKMGEIITSLKDKYDLNRSGVELDTGSRVRNILEAVDEFITRKTQEDRPSRGGLSAGQKRKTDSLAFFYFCYLCFAANEGDQVVGGLPRNAEVVRSCCEHTADLEVFRNMLRKMTPGSFPDDFERYFKKYFEEVDFSEDVRLTLRDYISEWKDQMKSSEKGEKTRSKRGKRGGPSRRMCGDLGGGVDSDSDSDSDSDAGVNLDTSGELDSDADM